MRIISTLVIAAAAAFTAAAAAHAQTSGDDSARSRAVRQAGAPAPPVSDSLFLRAERLVREGHGAAGRALVDTLLAGTRPGSPQHGQALYWHASLAADAAEAERGYRRVIVEYPATAWAGDALLNLAQLELARGDQEQALLHLHRFGREYPGHESRARASFWLARLHFDRKNEPRGCAALATARVAVSPEDVELRNQIDYYAQRCIGVDTTGPLPSRAAASTPPARREPAARRDPAGDVPETPRTAVRDSLHIAAPDAVNAAALPARREAPAPDSSGVRPQVVPGGGYTVQVAAYSTREAAEALIEKLRGRGYTARLASSTQPFRVRVGRYDTRADAIVAQQRLKAKGIEGFVTEMERP